MTNNQNRNTRRSRTVLMLLPFLIFGGLAALFFMQLTSGRDTSELPSALIGNAVPTFDLPGLEGLSDAGEPVPGLSHISLRGQPTIVNIFASWCVPCRAEHPFLLSLEKEDSINLVGINYKDKPGNALRFLGALGNPYDRVGVDRKGRAAIDWGFYGIPETFLVDADGFVRHKIVGPIDSKRLETLKAEIAKLKN